MGKLSFKDKVVVVTGAASGIGAAICQRFGEAGSKIALLDMDKAGVKTAAGGLKDAGIDAVGIRCDVVDEAQCTSAIDKIIEFYGGIDILVNNAGITQRSAFVNTKTSVYRKVMAVNFFGSLFCTKAAIESLRVLRETYGNQVWESVIPVDTKFREASRQGLPISLMNKSTRGAKAYQALLDSLLNPKQEPHLK